MGGGGAQGARALPSVSRMGVVAKNFARASFSAPSSSTFWIRACIGPETDSTTIPPSAFLIGLETDSTPPLFVTGQKPTAPPPPPPPPPRVAKGRPTFQADLSGRTFWPDLQAGTRPERPLINDVIRLLINIITRLYTITVN